MGTKTNRETLEWLSNAKERGLNNYELKDKAASFFGEFEGNKDTIRAWKEKFHKKEYNKRKEVTELIMKERGGTLGTRFMDIPPPRYFPEEIEKFTVNFSFSSLPIW